MTSAPLICTMVGMPTSSQWLAFLVASILFIQVPGPSLLFTIGRALTVGRREALLSVVGNALGLVTQVGFVAVGLGAVKYADLLPNRQSDYVFSWDKMLALQGNTAPYLQYAYARVRSIFRKGGVEHRTAAAVPSAGLLIAAPEELALSRHLLNFGLTLEAMVEECRPNFLCNYLYDLAGHFARVYDACPVLKAEDAVRASGLSHRHLLARFRAATGLAPKQHARILRFDGALDALAQGGDFAAIAVDAGFADQAHFTREFRELAGVTPGQWRAARPAQSHHVAVR